MLNFTVGPVQSNEKVRAIGAEQVPYFRTQEFSNTMLENEHLIKKFSKASADSRCVFITGSGTAAMEASVVNFFNENDKILVINGGSFGQRFADICRIHKLNFTELKLNPGKTLRYEQLDEYSSQGFTGLLVNIHETSTGVYYDPNVIGDFCKRNGIFLIVDAISSFLADPLDVIKCGINVMITSSQKALACPPGISIILMDGIAIERLDYHDSDCLYLNLKNALIDGERGQTPFTPAVSILLQINQRLKDIDASGGVEKEIEKTKQFAEYFRNSIKDLPYEIFSDSLSNAVTPLHPLYGSAYDVFLKLKDGYGIWICPNGGELKNQVFRVGHIGNLDFDAYDKLINALFEIQ